MIDSQYAWHLPENQDENRINEISTTLKISNLLAQILYQRGYQDVKTAHAFLNPHPDQLHDANLLYDIHKAVDRINAAIIAGEHITIYGDYDSDGLTSTALMYEALAMVGADVDYYIPNRFKDGYGPNVTVYEDLIARGTQLIVTVDNGVAGHLAINRANELGVDVIVTDHHALPKKLPEAFAIVHPRHPEGHYPFGELSGVGVAFKVASVLLEEIPQEMLDLVAIGEIADLVSLTDENRVLVNYGLKMIAQTERPGLQALLDIAKIEAPITSTAVGFAIAPRLNALGRLGDAMDGVKLLVTQDIDVAEELATKIDQLNQKRQTIVQEVSEVALKQALSAENQKRNTLVIVGDNWHEGILGIVASKIVEQTHKPTIVLTHVEQNLLKGSGRSVASVDLYAALAPISDHFVGFGGHAAAAGMSLASEELVFIKDTFEANVTASGFDVQQKIPLEVAGKLELNAINANLYAELAKLAPFGMDNPKPEFEITAQVGDVKQIGQAQQHLKFSLVAELQQKVPAIAFNQGLLAAEIKANAQAIKVIGTVDENVWQGVSSYQILIKDLKQAGLAIIDARTNKLKKNLFAKNQQYVFFKHKLAKQVQPYISKDAHIVDLEKANNILDDQITTIVDLPADINDLNMLQNHTYRQLTVIFYTPQQVYLAKLPTKHDFANLYKFIAQHHDLLIKDEIQQLASYLQVDKSQLTFMIQVFFELGFVTIDNGVLNGVVKPPKAELGTAPSYQARLKKQAVEKVLIYSKTTELKDLLSKILNPNVD
ncbi:single-stranded-DNA-specific exonuclease [Weissella beninensis]|uniref:Single-stranded-DNA-specific exonuclease RecJ n=1 Tax=Periweissella beninensis TaxID=504936 RepID=A0ABT0VK27_9LACO|nr:single-stranded-DNA-specific exonuclease RecJ [Periweissella beninensis]MBM7544518.1 single-stranded-DNA-specific exonuclease [Periweissella beninensis]MCM2438016.1 single-stranded-DNA-specific exonuclease RecJ [Periweissella beninensis]